jgi:protein associated with RNAse G/E
MTYNEYRTIINDAVKDYCNSGGSLLNIALNKSLKEYIYEFDEKLSEDAKDNLIDKAHQAMRQA